jgi:hypothetical protein
MKYSEKASRYLELCGLEKPDRYQAEKLSSLRRELSALGLDPQHTTGLTYRALVYDNRRLIEAFLDLSDNKKDTAGIGRQLHSFGIDISRKQELRLMLAKFKTCKKETDRKKTVKGVNLAKQAFESEWAQEDAEIAAEEKVGEANRLAFGT